MVIRISYLLILALFLCGCQKPQETVYITSKNEVSGPISCDKPEFNPKELTSNDLFFDSRLNVSSFCQSMNGSNKPPQDLLDAINKTTDHFMDGVFFDLNLDEYDEYIVKGDSPSGGTTFYFFQKQNSKWKVILTINGGFVLSSYDHYEDKQKKIDKDYLKITNWSRYGFDDTHQTEYAYANNEYSMISDQRIPLVLLHQKDFLELMIRLNDKNVRWN